MIIPTPFSRLFSIVDANQSWYNAEKTHPEGKNISGTGRRLTVGEALFQ